MKIPATFIVICVFLSCESTVLTDTAVPPPPSPTSPNKVKPAPGDTAAADTVPGLKEIYEDAKKGFEDNKMGQIANCQYVCSAINTEWELNIQPVSGTGNQAANMKYLLEMVDLANSMLGHTTSYGTGSYATEQAVDATAVNQCVNTLIVPPENGRFVAVINSNGIDRLAYSTDGINWERANLPQLSRWISVTYGGGKFVAVAASGTYTVYSTDGINWTRGNLPAMRMWRSVTYGDGKFVAVAASSDKGAYSTDGINWTEGGALPESASWGSVTYGTP